MPSLPPRKLEHFPFVKLKQVFGPLGSRANSALCTHGIHEVQRHVPGHRRTEGENGGGSVGFEAKTQQGTQ